MNKPMKKQSWWMIILGVMPSIAILLLDVYQQGHPLAIVIIITMLSVYIFAALRHKMIQIWSLFGIGISLSYLFSVLWRTLFLELSQSAISQLNATYYLLFLLIIVAATWLAYRRWGMASILLILPWLLNLCMGVIDPTYAWFIYYPDSQLAANITEAVVRIPAYLILPILVLRCGKIWLPVIACTVISMELAVFAGIPRLIGMNETYTINAPSITDGLLHMLTVNQMIIVIMMLPIIGLMWFYGMLGDQSSSKRKNGSLMLANQAATS